MKNWTCPRKMAARKATLLIHPCPNQYWSMAGLCDGPACELVQILDAGLIQPDQFHGVEIDRGIYEQNVQNFPEVSWHHGDFFDVMRAYRGFNPSLVNADLLQGVDTAADYIVRFFPLLAPFEVTLVVNFVLEHRGYHTTAQHVLDELANRPLFDYALEDGWLYDDRCYEYPGTTGHGRTTMGTFIFRHPQAEACLVAS
jgi:hypothetical protein